MKVLLLVSIFISTLLSTSYNYEEGRHLYFQKGCNNCHGTNAEGSSYYPSLAHKKEEYLKEKLLAFQRGEASSQKAEVMFTFAKSLSKKQIFQLSTFLANFQDKTTQNYEISDDLLGGTN